MITHRKLQGKNFILRSVDYKGNPCFLSHTYFTKIVAGKCYNINLNGNKKTTHNPIVMKITSQENDMDKTAKVVGFHNY